MEEALDQLVFSNSEYGIISLKSVIKILIQAVANACIVFIVWLPEFGLIQLLEANISFATQLEGWSLYKLDEYTYSHMDSIYIRIQDRFNTTLCWPLCKYSHQRNSLLQIISVQRSKTYTRRKKTCSRISIND